MLSPPAETDLATLSSFFFRENTAGMREKLSRKDSFVNYGISNDLQRHTHRRGEEKDAGTTLCSTDPKISVIVGRTGLGREKTVCGSP